MIFAKALVWLSRQKGVLSAGVQHEEKMGFAGDISTIGCKWEFMSHFHAR